MEQLRFKVRVNCMTFNHAPYIVDAMNGFCMQETTFPFVCIIIDDASTDGEPEIIKAYLEENFDLDDKAIVRNEETENYRLVFARHKTNLSCYFAALFLKYNHYRIGKPKGRYYKEWTNTKYIAICEGDDYWLNSQKLQKQVDCLEKNNRVNIAVHNAIRRYSDGTEELFNNNIKTGVYNLKQCLYMGWFTPTASFLYRNNFDLSPLWSKNGSNGDMAILYSNLMRGNLFYSEKCMSVYNYGTLSSLSSSTPRSVLYKKKRGMLKTINQLSNNKYLLFTLPLIISTYIKQTIWYYFKIIHLK